MKQSMNMKAVTMRRKMRAPCRESQGNAILILFYKTSLPVCPMCTSTVVLLHTLVPEMSKMYIFIHGLDCV